MQPNQLTSGFRSFEKCRQLLSLVQQRAKQASTEIDEVMACLKEHAIPAAPVTRMTAKGVQFTAILSPGKTDNGLVLLFHGLNSSSQDMLARAVMLHRKGYGFLLVDFPKYSDRVYPYYTFGQNEAAIVDASNRYIQQTFPNRPFCLFGVSMGAVAILMSQYKSEASALVLESPYWSLAKVVHNGLEHHLGIAGRLIERPFLSFLRLFHGVRNIQPIAEISALRTPLFLIGGEVDPYMCPNDMQQLHASARGDKRLWIVPDAAHDDYLQARPAEYTCHIQAFLTSRLTDTN